MLPVVENEFYAWESPSTDARIHISLNVVQKLREAAVASPVEVGGVLLGSPRADGGGLQITGLRPLPRPDRPDRRFTVSPADDPLIKTGLSAARQQSNVVGFYRTHRREGFSLDPDDAAFFRLHFTDPSNVFLLVRPDDSRECTAALFCWDEGQFQTTADVVEHPFEAHSLRQRETYVPPPPVRVKPPKPKASRSIWILSAFPVFAIALIAAGLLVRPAARKPAPPPPAPVPLGLQVESQKGHLRVSWNKENPHVRAAHSGLLTVADGVHPVETIPLSTRQLQAGTLLYVPSAKRMQFRLDVDDGRKISESVVAFPVFPAAPDVKRRPSRK